MQRKSPKEEGDESNMEEEATEEVEVDDSDSSDSSLMSSSSDDEDDDDEPMKDEAEGGEKKKDWLQDAMEDEDVDGDELLRTFKAEREKKKADHPPDLSLGPHSPSCMSFHQTNDILAVATFDGDLRLYGYTNEANTLLHSANLVEGSVCREVAYTVDGDKIILASCTSSSGSNDLHIYDVKEGLRVERKISSATKSAVSSLYPIDENVFATGDDDGHLQLWDKRSKDAYATLKLSDDCISSMITNHEKKILVCTSTDGTLFAVKIRGGTVQTESELYDSEFNCIGLFKQESKIAVGNGEGSLHVFNWNEFGRHADIYTGIGKKKEPINALIPITERIILTGGEDGCIRGVNIYPQKYLGLVGQVPYSIEKMDVCNDGHLVASLGSDEEVIKFWNVSYFEKMHVGAEEKVKNKSKPLADDASKSNLPSSSNQNKSDFYQGLL